MRRLLGNLWLIFVAAGVLPAAGCGISQNPSRFPYLFPTGNIIRTHAKPRGFGYFSDFDPQACRIEVRPKEASNPVGTQHVLIATVYDGSGQPRRGRRVEWMLEGAGHIVEVDESGYAAGRGYKVDNRYAVSYTDYNENTITRGNRDPNDDFTIRPGQTWCVITSPMEGDTYITAYAPGIYNWDQHKVHVVKHWINASWTFPPPAVNRIGTQHVFTTNVFRASDRAPIANYRVRYTILDGPPAVFQPGGQRVAEAISDTQGIASVTLVQTQPQPGINRVGIEVIRPPDAPTGVGITLGHGETAKEWIAANIQINKSGPPSVGIGQPLTYNITITNNGKIDSEPITVRDPVPDGLTFVNSNPPANPEGRDLIWTLGPVAAGRAATIQATFRAERVGTFTNCAQATTPDGLRVEHCTTTNVATAGLNVTKTGPATATVGQPINYQITVTNTGGAPATNVVVTDEFDQGLEHQSNPPTPEIRLDPFNLQAGESRSVNLVLTPRRTGSLVNRVTATADGGLVARAQHPVNITQPRLALRKQGPTFRYARRPAEWTIQVANAGDTPLSNVVVRDQLPPELTFQQASDGGQLAGNQVVWNLGTLQPREERTLRVMTRAEVVAPRVINTAVATADGGLQERAEAAMEIRGIPALMLEALDAPGGDPVPVGGRTTYEIRVSNTGSLPANQIEIVATLPPQMKPISAQGPTQQQARFEGNKVIFAAVDGLPPGRELSYRVVAEALEPGDVRFRVELRSLSLGAEPVVEEEPTNIYRPLSP